MVLKPGDILQNGTYKIVEILGKGGFGITYRAEEPLSGRQICIKQLLAADQKSSFIREYQTLSRFDHSGIVKINSVFQEGEDVYYTMDYIDGDTLKTIISERSGLPDTVAVKYIRALAKGLQYIHNQNVLHLDIKPSNIIIRKKDDQPILIDFGTSKRYNSEGEQTSLTRAGVSNGYAPIEQYIGSALEDFSPQTDIYSLGATLYTMVTGKVPPTADVVMNEGLPELPTRISKSLRLAILKSMSPSATDRPDSVQSFLDIIDSGIISDAEPIVNDTPIEERETPTVLIEERTPSIADENRYTIKHFCEFILNNKKRTAIISTCIVSVLLLTIAISLVPGSNKIATSGYVDLRLPSGTLWSACNLGAEKPEEYGCYFAWGETEEKNSYTNENYTGEYIFKDPAVTMSDDSRTPYSREIEELIEFCSWEVITYHNVRGYKVSSRVNKNAIFLPFAGYKFGKECKEDQETGKYWSRSADGDNGIGLRLTINSCRTDKGVHGGRTIRPVKMTRK